MARPWVAIRSVMIYAQIHLIRFERCGRRATRRDGWLPLARRDPELLPPAKTCRAHADAGRVGMMQRWAPMSEVALGETRN